MLKTHVIVTKLLRCSQKFRHKMAATPSIVCKKLPARTVGQKIIKTARAENNNKNWSVLQAFLRSKRLFTFTGLTDTVSGFFLWFVF